MIVHYAWIYISIWAQFLDSSWLDEDIFGLKSVGFTSMNTTFTGIKENFDISYHNISILHLVRKLFSVILFQTKILEFMKKKIANCIN